MKIKIYVSNVIKIIFYIMIKIKAIVIEFHLLLIVLKQLYKMINYHVLSVKINIIQKKIFKNKIIVYNLHKLKIVKNILLMKDKNFNVKNVVINFIQINFNVLKEKI